MGEPEHPVRPRPPAGLRADTRPMGRDSQPPERSERPAPRGPAQYWEAERRGGFLRGGLSSLGPRSRPSQESSSGRGLRQPGPPRAGAKGPRTPPTAKPLAKEPARAARPLPQAKPRREKTPPPLPFTPTPEQVAHIEMRYRELAQPVEFDGIRTRIAHELNIPKSAVKRIIKALREREGLPSWWEVQPYRGNSEELARIRALYEPLLPVPPIGVHRIIAEQLSLKPTVVYQAIRVIRQELKLPQYNDPSIHTAELTTGPQAGENRQAVPVLLPGTLSSSQIQEIAPLEENAGPPVSTGATETVATPESMTASDQ